MQFISEFEELSGKTIERVISRSGGRCGADGDRGTDDRRWARHTREQRIEWDGVLPAGPEGNSCLASSQAVTGSGKDSSSIII